MEYEAQHSLDHAVSNLLFKNFYTNQGLSSVFMKRDMAIPVKESPKEKYLNVLNLICRNIGAAIYGGGTVLEILCVMGYMIDTYEKYAASAMAAIIVLRSVFAFALPLAAPSL